MAFDQEQLFTVINQATLETTSSIIWNAFKLKKIIDFLGEDETYQPLLAEIEEIPIEEALSGILYKMNAEIMRVADKALVGIVNIFGELLKE